MREYDRSACTGMRRAQYLAGMVHIGSAHLVPQHIKVALLGPILTTLLNELQSVAKLVKPDHRGTPRRVSRCLNRVF